MSFYGSPDRQGESCFFFFLKTPFISLTELFFSSESNNDSKKLDLNIVKFFFSPETFCLERSIKYCDV